MLGEFFAFARERHSIYLRRKSGAPFPWTDDPVLQTGRFTNVYRELDRTTVWFRQHVRDPLRDQPEVLLAAVVFRWFNRTTTGEVIFCQPDLFEGQTAFESMLDQERPDTQYGTEMGFNTNTKMVAVLRQAIVTMIPKGPWVTGAYTINTISAPPGLTKLEGVLDLIRQWMELHPGWMDHARGMLDGQVWTLEQFCDWVRSPCLGEFMAYELACDLRWTGLLERAPDVLTWANAGPGAIRGLNRIHGRPVKQGLRQAQAVAEMRDILGASRYPSNWPRWSQDLAPRLPFGIELPPWELREVEHTLCEFDKHQRVRAGDGQTRGRFTP